MDEKAKELFQKNWGDTSMVYAGELYDLGSLDYIGEYHKSTFSGIITFLKKIIVFILSLWTQSYPVKESEHLY